MARGKWLGRWFKVFDNFDEVDENGLPRFWTGSIDNDELGAWFRLLAWGSRCVPKAIIQAAPGLAFTDEQVKSVLKTDKNYLDKWSEQGSIKLKNGIIYIQNWKLWQNEQDRKAKQPPESGGLYRNSKQPQREGDVVVVKEKTKTKTTTKDTRVKKLIDYFFQAHMNTGKGKVHINGGKDGQKMTDLLKTFSEQEIKEKIDLFMKYSDPWMKDKPYSIGMFASQFNKLVGVSETKPKFMPKEVV